MAEEKMKRKIDPSRTCIHPEKRVTLMSSSEGRQVSEAKEGNVAGNFERVENPKKREAAKCERQQSFTLTGGSSFTSQAVEALIQDACQEAMRSQGEPPITAEGGSHSWQSPVRCAISQFQGRLKDQPTMAELGSIISEIIPMVDQPSDRKSVV